MLSINKLSMNSLLPQISSHSFKVAVPTSLQVFSYYQANYYQLSSLEKFLVQEADQQWMDHPWTAHQWSDLWSHFPHTLLDLFYCHEKFLGFALWFSPLIPHEYFHLLKIVILPAFRRQGYAQQYWHNLRKRYVDKNFFLEVAHTNQAALQFYEKIGFYKIMSVPHFYGPENHAWRMELRSAKA